MGEGPICQGHKNPQEKRLKERFKSNFHIGNKRKLFGSKQKHKNKK
jgi:hypothetical protein